MTKIWRCTVCGYLHEGEQPPDICPICKVDASKLELLSDAETPASQQAGEQSLGFFAEMRSAFVPHAVSAHFPNALLPTLGLFLLLYFVSGNSSFELSSYYLLLITALVVPATFVTGLLDWKKHYGGKSATIFRNKILLGLLLLVLGTVSVLLRWLVPDVLSAGGWLTWLYCGLLLTMLICVTLLGHYGGMLVFARAGR